MLVGKKICQLKKKCWLENFPCQKRTCPECPEFPVMQDPKTAEAENSPLGPRGKKGVRWNMKILSVRKTFFCWLEKQNVGCEKKLSVEKKISVGEFPLPKIDMSRMSGIPCNARPKNGRGGKKTP